MEEFPVLGTGNKDRVAPMVQLENQRWSSLFGKNSYNLEYVAAVNPETKRRRAPEEVYDASSEEWKNCVAVQFLGKPPNFSLIQRVMNILWGRKGYVKITAVKSNVYVIQLPSEETRTWVLESGPWHIQNRPIFVRKWEPHCDPLVLDMKKVPLWFKLLGIPLELFTRMGLSFIASGLGRPLYMDKLTALRHKVDFAKVCVEVDCSMEIPDSLEVELQNGEVVRVGVEVPWMPPRCHSCGVFGHNECKAVAVQKVEKKWLPKAAEEVKVDEGIAERKIEMEIGGGDQTPSADRGKVEGKKKLLEDGGVLLYKSTTTGASGSTSKVKENRNGTSGSKQSGNRFAILQKEVNHEAEINVVLEEQEDCLPSPRRVRAASVRMKDIMVQLKPKRRSPGAKAKAKAGKAVKISLEGPSLSAQ